ncbi:MAG: hypothetical protein H7320_04860 [Ferruginibacter sp.]|nr:hypothetical protein [Ferruginibacter sp.]
MMNDTLTPAAQDRVFDEFSPKKMIEQIQSVIRYILSKWLIILLVASIFCIIGAVYTSFKKPTYVAEITFALDEGAAQSARTDLSAISEQLGIGPIMEAGGVFSSVTNIVELMKSRLLVEKTLRSKVNLYGKDLFFADFFLDSLSYREKWMKDSQDKFDLRATKKSRQDSLYENNIIRNIYEAIITSTIKIDTKGKGTSIIAVTCVSENELFTKYFLEALIQEVTSFYIDTKTQRAKINVAFLQKRTDSINNAFTSSLYGKAAFTDANINAVRQVATVSGDRQLTNIQIQKATYTELYRSLEAAKTTLMKETPLIQYIDMPILPLKLSMASAFKNSIIGFILGMVLATGFFTLYKVFRHFLPKEEELDICATYYPAARE